MVSRVPAKTRTATSRKPDDLDAFDAAIIEQFAATDQADDED